MSVCLASLASYSDRTIYKDKTCKEVAFTKDEKSDGIFSNLSCFKDIKKYYPGITKGSLNWPQQKRFFRCLHDTLEIFTKISFAPDSRQETDGFTKTDLFNLFHWHLGQSCVDARRLMERVFAIKKILIGGSADKLKDSEIVKLYKLIYDYREIYFVLHRHIPTFKKVFSKKAGNINPEENEKALKELKTAFILLERAYLREKISYPIEDIFKYGDYFKEAEFVEPSQQKTVRQSFRYLHHLFQGLFSPKRKIKGKDWNIALSSLHKTISLFFHYKSHFTNNMPRPWLILRMIESAEIFISSLKKDFPLENLDEMLSSALSFVDKGSSAFKNSWLAHLAKNDFIPLLTRTLVCFSLDRSSNKKCKSEWGKKSSSPTVRVSFKDRQFDIFPNKIKSHKLSHPSVVISRENLQFLSHWMLNYKRDIQGIFFGYFKPIAKSRGFNHWQDSFFGWEKNNRIEFGSFHKPEHNKKKYQLLNYQVFLPLLFDSYFPDNFFSPSQKGQPVSISKKTWEQMITDMAPVFLALSHKSSLREYLIGMFDLADSFLYSSNRDKQMSAEELVDLTVHILEGIKTAQLADKRIFQKKTNHLSAKDTGSPIPSWPDASNHLSAKDIAQAILTDEEILSAYPRFKKYLFPSQMEKYAQKITSVLKGEADQIKASHLLPLFVLIQIMELNYHLIDQNLSFNLESEELLLFAKKFDKQLAEAIPYVFNPEQARDFLMYSFKTGDMPFFTGDQWTPLKFAHWHLNPHQKKPFKITPNEFHFFIFDFYNLQKQF